MLAYYKDNIQLYILFSVWLIVGIYADTLSYGLIPLCMLFMYRKKMFEELILGFLFILILSDSLDDSLSFAKNLKNIYIVILAVFFFFDTNNFQPLNKLYKIFFPFFIFAFCITLLSVNESFFYTSLQKTISFILLFMILPNFFTKLYRENGEAFLRRFVFFVITFLLIGFLLKYSGSDFVYLENGRYRGVLGSPNGLGLYGVLAFVFFLCVE